MEIKMSEVDADVLKGKVMSIWHDDLSAPPNSFFHFGWNNALVAVNGIIAEEEEMSEEKVEYKVNDKGNRTTATEEANKCRPSWEIEEERSNYYLRKAQMAEEMLQKELKVVSILYQMLEKDQDRSWTLLEEVDNLRETNRRLLKRLVEMQEQRKSDVNEIVALAEDADELEVSLDAAEAKMRRLVTENERLELKNETLREMLLR